LTVRRMDRRRMNCDRKSSPWLTVNELGSLKETELLSLYGVRYKPVCIGPSQSDFVLLAHFIWCIINLSCMIFIKWFLEITPCLFHLWDSLGNADNPFYQWLLGPLLANLWLHSPLSLIKAPTVLDLCVNI
jgi:hypothetical protein